MAADLLRCSLAAILEVSDDTSAVAARSRLASRPPSAALTLLPRGYHPFIPPIPVHHRMCHLQETRDVGSVHQVAGGAVFLRGLEAVGVDGAHDLVEAVLDLLARPRQPHAVLRHLETR